MGNVEAGAARAGETRTREDVWRGLVADLPQYRDQTQARVAVLQQLMLAAAVLAVAIFAIIAAVPGDVTLFFVGVGMVFALAVITLVVPWNSLPAWVIGFVPLLDLVAILLIRLAYPQSGLAVLWLFPVMWLSAALGLIGYIGSNVLVSVAYWSVIAGLQESVFTFSVVLLPVIVLAVSTGTFFRVRRVVAQRTLLDKQALVLAHNLEITQHQEQLVTQVLDSVDFGVIRIAADGAVTITNEAHGRMQQALLSPDGRRELPAFDADGTTPLDPERMPLMRARRGEIFDNQIVWFGAPDTPRRALSVTARRLRDTQGEDAGVVVISRDVTAERTALRARDNVVASVSHELRSPLTAILGYLDLAMESEGIPPKVRGDLEVATQNAERMIQIISDILSASSSSKSSVDLTISPQDVDLQRLVLEAAGAWEPAAHERSITVFTDEVRPANAYVDPARMRQVADNLISNAIKYGREGGSIELAVYSDQSASYLLVRDDGIGISADDQRRLFQRFFRAQSEVGGTGLGLAISRDIVRAHGGEIIVGIIYISETLIRRDEGSGRHWSIAFLAGIVTTIAYALWAGGAGWIAVATGNAAFVAATGFIWLGCRSFNQRRMLWPCATVGAGMAIAFVAVAVEGPDGGDWAGVIWMYLVLTVLASLGFWETLRGRLVQTRTTIALSVVLAIEAVYTAIRGVAFLALGPEDVVFQTWFSTIPSSFVTITLVITAAIVTSILRAGRAGMRGYTHMTGAEGSERILSEPQFRATLADVIDRAQEKKIGVGVIAIRIDDLPHIATAFGVDVGRQVALAARDAVRRMVEPLAVIGDDGATVLRVCATATDLTEIRQQAYRLARAVFEALRAIPDAVVPVVGVGVATTRYFGYDADALETAADAASVRSSTHGDISLVFAEPPTTTGAIPVPGGPGRADQPSSKG